MSRLSIKSFAAAFLLSGVLVGCSTDDLDIPDNIQPGIDIDTQLVLKLAVPASDADEAVPESRSGKFTPDAGEAAVNSLTFVAFGYDGGANVVRHLTVPAKMPVDQGYATYQLSELTPGRYSVYVLANIDLAPDQTASEGKLREALLDFTSQLPQPGNLPMVYHADGSYLQVNAAGEGNAIEVNAQMTIAAVKLCYNLIFDKNDNDSDGNPAALFANNGLRFDRLTISSVAAEERIVADESFTSAKTRSVATSGSYFSNFTVTPANADIDNRSVVETQGDAAASPVYNGKYVYQGTAYLPERYVAAGGTPSRLDIEAVVTDAAGSDANVRCKYTIDLGPYQGNNSEKSLPRGTYYELVAHIRTLGEAELDASIYAKDWSAQYLDADLMSTTLTLDRTRFEVTSFDSDSLYYSTDATAAPQFECKTQLLSRPVVIATFNAKEKKIGFDVNPDIAVYDLAAGQGKGTAKCYITAGNIRKEILIDYDIQPFFTIDLTNKATWNSTNGSSDNVRYYNYRTNLGGLLVTARGNKSSVLINASKTESILSYADSRVKLSCADPSASQGVLMVTLLQNPVTTTSHFFDSYPAVAESRSGFDSYRQATNFVAMPPPGNYRIYFRAINDWQIYNGGETSATGEWLEGQNSINSSLYPTEYNGTAQQNNNWIDYWHTYNQGNDYLNGASNNMYPNENAHRIYIWTQLGETTSAGGINNQIWRFTTGDYKSTPGMKGDYNNAGWYYFDLGLEQTPQSWENGASGNRIPEPGTTLIIFHNTVNDGLGYSVHRATHHLDPGIPLFNYEDNEGWVLYDPTCNPYYRIYDEKPVIEDVTYTIWSDKEPAGWYRKYGVAANEVAMGNTNVPRFTIWSENVQSVTKSGSYYCYKIRMKAPADDHSKDIIMKFKKGTATTNLPQRIYYFYKDGGLYDPRIYIYTDGGAKSHEWDQTPQMTWERDADGGKYYYYDVPAAYANGRVIFQSNDRSQQTPGSNQAGYSIGGKTKILYSDSGSWMDYTPAGSGTTAPTFYESVLFGGKAFPNNEGFYNSSTGKWTAGKP